MGRKKTKNKTDRTSVELHSGKHTGQGASPETFVTSINSTQSEMTSEMTNVSKTSENVKNGFQSKDSGDKSTQKESKSTHNVINTENGVVKTTQDITRTTDRVIKSSNRNTTDETTQYGNESIKHGTKHTDNEMKTTHNDTQNEIQVKRNGNRRNGMSGSKTANNKHITNRKTHNGNDSVKNVTKTTRNDIKIPSVDEVGVKENGRSGQQDAMNNHLDETETHKSVTSGHKQLKGKRPGLKIKGEEMFPRCSHWVLFLLTLTLRVWYVTTPSNWWILHPDEIYQTMEVAHSDVYGYGFRSYEYLPPPGSTWFNMTSEVRRSEVKKGMYSLRSFLLPKLLAVVMHLGRVLVPDTSPYLVIKIFHVIMTSALPVTVYKFSLVLYESRNVAILAAIFICSSTTLNVFGTHTLSNSFISPVLFYCLIPLIKILKRQGKELELLPWPKKGVNNNDGKISQGNHVTGIHQDYLNGKAGYTNGELSNVQTNVLYDNISHNKENGYRLCSYTTLTNNVQNGDVNGNLVKTLGQTHTKQFVSNKEMNGCTNGYLSYESQLLNQRKFQQPVVNGKCKTYSNGHLFTNGSLHKAMKSDGILPRNETAGLGKWKFKQFFRRQIGVLGDSQIFDSLCNCMSGLMLALCIYMRADCAIIPTLCVLVLRPGFVCSIVNIINEMRFYIIGFVTGALIGGFDDHVMYDKWFISPIQWFKFNVWYGGSSAVFGTMGGFTYLENLISLEPLMYIILTVLAVNVTFSIASWMTLSTHSFAFKNQNSALFVLIVLFMLYSLPGHKEFRFVHNGVVFIYIAFSQSCLNLINIVMKLSNNQKRKFKSYLTYLLTALFISSHIYNFINLKESRLSRWTYSGIVTSQEVNVCLDYLRQQDDVRGVYIEHDIYMTGGYSILHKDVSVLGQHGLDTFEYSTNTRFSHQQSFFTGDTRLKSLALFRRVSEFISHHNRPYILKHLINQPDYNYVILPSKRKFVDNGYRKVFKFGGTKILKRTFLERDET